MTAARARRAASRPGPFCVWPDRAAGHVSLLIPPASFATLWPDIRRHARHAGPVQIRVGPDQITFCGGPLQISATITRI